MTTATDVYADLERFGQTALRIKAERDEAVALLRRLLEAMDREDDGASWRNHEIESEGHALLARIASA